MNKIFNFLSLLFMIFLLTACGRVSVNESTAGNQVQDKDSETAVAKNNKQPDLFETALKECQKNNDTDCKISVYTEMYEAGDLDGALSLTSLYRSMHRLEEAYAMTARVAKEHPELSGRMLFVNGDIASSNEKNYEKAIAFYDQADREYGYQLLGETPIGLLALKNLAVLLAKTDRNLAGEKYREIITKYSDYVDQIDILFDALILEASGTNMYSLFYEGKCLNFCIIENKTMTEADEVPEGFYHISEDQSYANFYFKLSDADQKLLEKYK